MSSNTQVVLNHSEESNLSIPAEKNSTPFSFPKLLAFLFLCILFITGVRAVQTLNGTNEFIAVQNILIAKAIGCIGTVLALTLLLVRSWNTTAVNGRVSERVLWLLPFLAFGILGNTQAAFSALLLVLASFSVGIVLFSRFQLLEAVTSYFSALVVGFGLNAYLSWIALRFPINTGLFYGFALASELLLAGLLAPKAVGETWRLLFSRKLKMSFAEICIVGQLLLVVPYVITPSFGYDELVKHLYVPRVVERLGMFPFVPSYSASFDTSLVPQNMFIVSYLLGGHYAVRILDLFLLSLSALIVMNFVEERFGRRASATAVLLMLSSPLLLVVTTLVFQDPFYIFVTSCIFCSVLSKLLQKEEVARHEILERSILMGVAVITKLQALVTSAPLALALFIKSLLQRYSDSSRKSLLRIICDYSLGVVIAITILAPPFAYNYWKVKNPLFPFYNGVFRSPYFLPSNFVDDRWLAPLNFSLLSELTFFGSRHVENNNLSFGLLTFVLSLVFFIPFVLSKTDEELRKAYFLSLGLYAALFLSVFKTTGPYLRYFLGTLPLAAVTGALLFESLARLCSRSLVARGFLSIAGLTFIVLNVMAQFASRNVPIPYPIYEAWTQDFQTPNFQRQQNLRAMMLRLSKQYGSDASCAMLDQHAAYQADCDVRVDGWHFDPFLFQIDNSKTPVELFDTLFRRNQFAYIVMPNQTQRPLYMSNEFLSMLVKIDSADIFSAYRPRKSILRQRQDLPLAPLDIQAVAH